MSVKDGFIAEYQMEMATTRKALERLPEGRFAFKPHEKSYSLGELGTHLANLQQWVGVTLNMDAFDVGVHVPRTEALKTTGAVLEMFDKNVAEAVKMMADAPDDRYMESWSLKNGDTTVFTMPKAAVLRSFVLNHTIHHRGQLTVYLRLNDVALPMIYGPTADEQM